MKSIGYILFLALLPLAGCDKDENDNLKLPPATQTGARTFGCLVDGKVFGHNDGVINCFYQLIEGGYYFGISAEGNITPKYIHILGNQVSIVQGESYPLSTEDDGNFFALAAFEEANDAGYTDEIYQGELTITKFDLQTNIISGTFWFDIPHPITGDTVEIREGRFDTYFTQ